MNDLSWLLYLGDVSGSISHFFGFFGFVLFIVGGIATFGAFIALADDSLSDTSINSVKSAKNFGIFAVIFGFFLMVAATLLPSKETVYLIAASEAGEEVVTSKTGQKAIDAVNRYLDSVTPDGEKKEE